MSDPKIIPPINGPQSASQAANEGYNQAQDPAYAGGSDPSQVQENPDAWPLEADRMAVTAPLIEALQIMAGYYGRRTSFNSLTSGLPIPATGITPVLFERAAARADLHARLAERSLEALAIAPNLPCILVLEHKQACILWDVKHPEGHPPKKEAGKDAVIHAETELLVQFPETPDEKKVFKLSELKEVYTNYAFYIRPIARMDERAGSARIDTARDWFWGALKSNMKIYKEVMLATLMINVFALASTLYIMNVYDRVIPNAAYETLWVLSLGALTVYVFDFIMKNMRSYFLDIAGRKSDVKISGKLFEQVLGMTLAARPASAGVLASNMREFETIRDFFTSATMTAIVDVPFSLMFVLVIAIIAGPLAIIPLAAIPIVVIVGWFLQKPMQKIMRQSMNENAMKNALLFETITGLETIKTQAAEGHVQRRWEELVEKGSRTSVQSKRVASFALNFSMFMQSITTIAIVITGVYLISAGTITQGALVASVILVGRALGPLSQIAALLTRFNQSWQALNALEELMKKPVERPADKHFISLPRVHGHVEFRDVTFKYPGQTHAALNSISFAIEPGDSVGIIGAVGSGKTTLERLLINLYQPETGAILLDGTDVRQIDPGDLRRNVGAVQQSPNLFYGSVRDNITMGHETAPDRAVIRAAELSGVMEFLRDSEKGLDTQVGERGESLSGGQRQAVAIARALLYDPSVLIMDEPTASMDPTSEMRLKKRLKELSKNKTTILITHKGTMLEIVNKLILIDRGRILAYGPKDEILRRLQNRDFTGSAA
ncbi:MAG: type I secretion system permease/ATPase [Micavibrio aeruginosavorus]|uniref:Type I secretion system permease/ATPase n=1 Tax=Micavibrio aeruginosavorus TaxID=349221 RepID=A0A2W5FLJ5_9BACT|nr:MAG: type I secretion system permease/ATPase [Micavibrio aeruginosavorus]